MSKQLLFTVVSILTMVSVTLGQRPGSYKALEFDGTDDHVLIPDISALNPTAQVTVEAWIKADAWSTNKPATGWGNSILCKHGWSTGNKGYTLRCGDNGILNFNISNSSGTWVESVSPAIMKTGVWYHVAGIFTGDSVNVYINGKLEATTLYSGAISPSNGLSPKIGDLAYSTGGTRLFKGQIDEVRIWNTALSKAELRDWMCRKVTSSHPKYSSLGGYYKLDEGTGTNANDKSPNANTAALTNGPNWVGSGAPLGDTSIHTYGGTKLSLPTKLGDNFALRSISGSPGYVHAYINYDTTEQKPALNVLGKIDSTHYFGVFHEDNSSVKFNIHYNFKNYTKVQGVKKCAVNMFTKTTGYQGSWGSTPNKLFSGDSLLVYNQVKNEFVMSLYETDSNKLITTNFYNPWLCDIDSIPISAMTNDSFQFAWYKDGNILSGKTKRTLLVGSIGMYKVKLVRKNTSCSFMSASIQITDRRPSVTWNSPIQTCENSDSIQLPEGSPKGGFFTGKYVSSKGVFQPRVAGAGKFTVYYNYTDVDGCTAKASSLMTLLDTSKLTVTSVSAVCPEVSPFTLNNVSPTGGIYSGTGISSNTFNPAQAGHGNHKVSFVLTNSKSCTSKASFVLSVYKPDSISVRIKAFACQNDEPFPLNIYPSGGQITSSAVVGTTFYPAFASIGWNKILYTIDDSHNCFVEDSASIYLSDAPNVGLSPFSSVCDNTPLFTISGGTPTDSGKYFVDGIQDTTFDPASKGKGKFTIEYKVTNYFGCKDSASASIRVNQSPVKPVIQLSGNDLVSNASKGNQWLDANGPIAGATDPVFSPTLDGYYFVKVTNDSNCSNLSDAFIFKKMIGIKPLLKSDIIIYPNPSKTGIFLVKGLPGNSRIVVTDPLGREMLNINESHLNQTVNLSHLIKGTYILEVLSESRKFSFKVVKVE